MKLELLTNATVVDDAIRFVASHAAPIEKVNSYKMRVDGEDRGHEKQQQSIVTTNNVF
jgi:hypothetical protein